LARRGQALHAGSSIIDIAEIVKSPPVASILSSLSSVLVLALIVAVHELGHFIGARSQGIKVENFSIGFGPTLFSYKPPNDNVEYTIRAFPAGGFVSFPKFYEIDDDGEY
jgi:RIP metalloprotease RseP